MPPCKYNVNSFIYTRTNHRSCYFKKTILKDFAKFTVKCLYWSHFLITLQALMRAALLETPAKLLFAAFLRTVFLWNNSA